MDSQFPEKYIIAGAPSFPGILLKGIFESGIVRHEGDRNHKFLYKEGAFENRLYFFVCSFKDGNQDKLSIEITNGNSSLFGGRIDAYLGVDVFYYDANGQQIFRTGFATLIRQPTRIEERDIPANVFVPGGTMKLVWYKGMSESAANQAYVTWSGTF